MAYRSLHRFNRGFEWRPPAGPYRFLSAQQVDSYNLAGYFVVEDALAPPVVEALVDEIDPIEARLSTVLSRVPEVEVPPSQFTVTTRLVQRSDLLRRVCCTGVLADLAHELLGPRVRLYWDQSVYKKPGSWRTFPWHQDNGRSFVDPQQYLTCWLALTDATEENGCPVIAPGMHRLGTLEHWEGAQGLTCIDEPVGDHVAVPMRAGSILAFSSLTVHCTWPNRTDAVRKAYVIQYVPDGAVIVESRDGEPPVTTPQDAPSHQFLLAETR